MMKKNIKHIIVFVLCLLIGIMGISSVNSLGIMAQAETKEKDNNKKQEQFTVESKTRVDNYTRRNQKEEIVTTVTNNGADFTGYVQVIMVTQEYGKNVMYQTDLVLAAGETKTISQEVRMTTEISYFMVHITDTKENVLAKKKVKVRMLDSDQCLIGILCDSKQNMGYWDGYLDKDKVVYLKKEDINSVSGMSVMDVLVINNVNTGDWEKNQYEAVKEWVEQGGTLIVGTGEQVNRTLAMFQDDYLVGRIGDVKKGIADISFQDEKVIEDVTDGIVLHRVEKGLGVICVADKELGLDKSEWEKKGYGYLDIIKKQYSTTLQERLASDSDYYSYSSYGDRERVLKGSDEVPRMKTYAWVLLVYIIMITIVVYLFLKKKDKLSWTWGVIPVISVIFSGLIIAIGSRTRINGAYMNYTKVVEFQEDENSTVKNEVYMDVGSSENSQYEVTVPEATEVYAKIFDYYDIDSDNKDYDDYNIGFKTKDDRNVIVFKNNQTFETVRLVSESIENVEGSYKSDFHFVDAKLSGTFTNNTQITIKNAIFCGEGKVYQLGTIKPGQTVEITDKTPSTIGSYYYMGYYSGNTDYYKIMGVDEDCTKWSLQEARYMEALEEIFQQWNDVGMEHSFVYGYVGEDSDKAMKKNWGINCYGITMLQFPIQLDYRNKNGDIYVADIITEKTSQVLEGYYDSSDHTCEESSENNTLLVEYTLGESEQLTGIYFSELLNPSIDKNAVVDNYGEAYEGTIEVYNWKTQKYEEIFQADKAGKVTDVKEYVGKGNVMRFRMIGKNKSEGYYYAPVISITKEVKDNG